jgi:hypothetical protein
VEDLGPDFLKEKGIKGIIVDLDNTLAPRDAFQVPEGIRKWVQDIKAQGIDLVVISNSRSGRTRKFAQELGLDHIANAMKPLPVAFVRASRKLKLPLKALAVVGDQIFTDVVGGNLCGAFTVLVSPLSKKTDFFTTKFVRLLESIVLKKYFRRKR